MEQRNTNSNRDVLFSSTEDSQQKAHITFTHTIFHAQLCHTHTHTYIHTYIRTYVHTYIRTYVHTYTFIRTCILSFHILSHTHSLSPPPLSFLPSPSPLELLKLIIGVIRSISFGAGGACWRDWPDSRHAMRVLPPCHRYQLPSVVRSEIAVFTHAWLSTFQSIQMQSGCPWNWGHKGG